jgi:serine/threonine protein kinase
MHGRCEETKLTGEKFLLNPMFGPNAKLAGESRQLAFQLKRRATVGPDMMPPSSLPEIDRAAAPFDRLTTIHRLGPDRRGHASAEHARHQLYVGHDRQMRRNLLVKLATKAGKVYQDDLTNEIATLSAINRELPDSPYFPAVYDHGHLKDGRVYLVSTFFDELPLATSIGTEWVADRLVAHLRTALEVTKAVVELHGAQIFHVDLNPMNILHRVEKTRPIIRIVDFESSYDTARHSNGVFYSPPTTTGYSAPEVSRQPPDARADVFSIGAVLYTMLAGYRWAASGEPGTRIQTDRNLDPELREILLKSVDVRSEERYASAGELGTAFAAYLEHIWPGRQW